MTQQSTALAKIDKSIAFGKQIGYTPEYIETIKFNYAKDATDEELKMFLEVCNSTKLNPFNKEIYFWKIGGKVVVCTAIDGYRKAADRTGNYAPGPAIRRDYDGEGKHISSTASVYKWVRGEKVLIEFTAYMNEWKKSGDFWSGGKASHQLDITAERHALKKAFPTLSRLTDESEKDTAPSTAALNESPEDAAKAESVRQELLRVGSSLCTPVQFDSLKAFVENASLADLQSRLESAMPKLRMYVLTEISKVCTGPAYDEFMSRAFQNGIDAATVDDFFSALDTVARLAQAAPIDSSVTSDGEPNEAPLSKEEEERIELIEKVESDLKYATNNDEAEIARLLAAREPHKMTSAALNALRKEIQEYIESPI